MAELPLYPSSPRLLTRPFTRRGVLGGALAVVGAAWVPARGEAPRPLVLPAPAPGFTRTHGLSAFGDLAMPPDFSHFAYVNPEAPKGGVLILQVTAVGGNQNFDTFNTLNAFVFRGDGAAGMGMVFDSLMAGTADEPDALYGLLAGAIDVSDDALVYRYFLRPEARFHDGSPVTASDVAFSINIMKEKGHYIYRQVLQHVAEATAEAPDVFVVRLSPERMRDSHLNVGGMPVFSEAFWRGKDFEAVTLERPLGSGGYKVGRFEPGQYIEFDRVPDYWGRDLPVNIGSGNFDTVRYEYYRERSIAFEAFKSGRISYHEEYTARIWATGYDFPAVREGRIVRETIPSRGPSPIQGWHFNTRLPKFADPRVRKAIGLCFDFEWVNRNIMFDSYERTMSYFQNTDMEARGLPSPEELALLEPFRAGLSPEVFGEPFIWPKSDGSGRDRALLRQANELFTAAGCTRSGNRLLLPSGEPFSVEFLDFQPSFQPHLKSFLDNLQALGVDATSRMVDASQYQLRLRNFGYEITGRAMGSSPTPGDFLENLYSSASAEQKGSYNIAGVREPAVDDLVHRIAHAKTRDELTIACRALDRVLRAGYYWVPMWFKAETWVACWDEFSRPETPPRFGSGAPFTWWYDAGKAKRAGRVKG
ncbi:MAG: extracellular solute-binding protein [Methylobacteriaceae bacterium]|jgi:microcin C transport system substrate-binding protein|nr:extracellular solute-binding protein [Methylobacteriaceae bacterium]